MILLNLKLFAMLRKSNEILNLNYLGLGVGPRELIEI